MHPLIQARMLLREPMALSRDTLNLLAFTLNTPAAFTAAPARRQHRQPTDKKVALIGVHGVITPRASLLSELIGTDAETIARTVRAAAEDDAVSQIVLDIDSPGGSVAGVPEAAAAILAARAKKPVTAVVNHLAASAGYWLASQASEIVMSPSGQAGSIGVVLAHHDLSKAYEREGIAVTHIYAGKYKIEGNDTEPLESEARDEFQRSVDSFYLDFLNDVARGRGMAVKDVIHRFGEGRLLRASKAQNVGMIDRIGTLDDVLSKHGVRLAAPSRQMSRAEELGKELLAQGYTDVEDVFATGRDAGALAEIKRQAKAAVKPQPVTQITRDTELSRRMQAAMAKL